MKSDHVARVLQAADLFALVSLWEGLSNALLEAMACGLPVLVSDVSGMADVVRDGVSGRIVPADDERAAREAFEREAEDADAERRQDEAEEDERVAEETGGWGPPGRGTD
jgi:glycosyltransferase involved in cell wall biosynthesis